MILSSTWIFSACTSTTALLMEMGCAVAERVAHNKTGTLIRRAFKVKFYSPKPVPPEARKGYLTSMMVSTQS